MDHPLNLATFRRKMADSEPSWVSHRVKQRCADGFLARAPLVEQGHLCGRHYTGIASALPILISVSAIIPNPTHRFKPSAPR